METKLTKILEGGKSKLTEWEESFCSDMLSKIKEYGENARFSKNQMGAVERIHFRIFEKEALTVEEITTLQTGLDELVSIHMDKLNDWETEFVESIYEKVVVQGNGFDYLSENQLNRFRKIVEEDRTDAT